MPIKELTKVLPYNASVGMKTLNPKTRSHGIRLRHMTLPPQTQVCVQQLTDVKYVWQMMGVMCWMRDLGRSRKVARRKAPPDPPPGIKYVALL